MAWHETPPTHFSSLLDNDHLLFFKGTGYHTCCFPIHYDSLHLKGSRCCFNQCWSRSKDEEPVFQIQPLCSPQPAQLPRIPQDNGQWGPVTKNPNAHAHEQKKETESHTHSPYEFRSPLSLLQLPQRGSSCRKDGRGVTLKNLMRANSLSCALI